MVKFPGFKEPLYLEVVNSSHAKALLRFSEDTINFTINFNEKSKEIEMEYS